MTISICATSTAQNVAQGMRGDLPLEIPVVCDLVYLNLDKVDSVFMQKYHVRYITHQESCNPLKRLHKKRNALKSNPPVFYTYRDLDKKYGDSWRKEVNPNASFIEEYLYKYPNASDSKVK